MNTRCESHFPDDLLENYAMGKLFTPHCGPLEEHLLLCRVCQTRLMKAEEFVL